MMILSADFMSHTMSWMLSMSAGIIALFLVVSIVKDGMEFARGYGEGGIAKILGKAVFLLVVVGLVFVITNKLPEMMLNMESNTIIADNSSTEEPVQAVETVAEATEETSVVEEPKPIEEVVEEPAPIVEETAQPTTEVVQAEPVVSTPDPNWMPKDTLEESWNYAVAHKWTIMYKGKEMDPKYISYKYYNITFDKDKYIVTLSDK